MKTACILTISLLLPAVLIAQGNEEAERWVIEMTDPETGDLDEAVIESVRELLENPLNLNTAREQELEASGLFSPYQVYGLLRYREEQGRIFTIYELSTIPGYSREFLEEILPFVHLSIEKRPQPHRPKGLFLGNTSLSWPVSNAYTDGDSIPPYYPGSPLKHSIRLKHSSGPFAFGLAMEKDPGETFLLHRYPDHLTGYVSWEPGSIIRQVILGNFRLHGGLGLVHGLGFRGSSTGVGRMGYRPSYARPFASTAEYGYYRGACAELGNNAWRSSAYAALQPVDLSFFGMTSLSSEQDLSRAIRETGYHRTSTERQGSGLGNQLAAGWTFAHISPHWNNGLSIAMSSVRLTRTGKDSVPWLPVDHSPNGNFSLYSTWHCSRAALFGEAALDRSGKVALLAGGNITFNPFFSASASFRKYDTGFRGQYPSAYGSGSEPENETGMNAGLSLVPFLYGRLYLGTDIWYHPAASYRSDFPGFCMRHTAEFSFRHDSEVEIRVICSAKQWQTDRSPDTPGTRGQGRSSRYRLRMQYMVQASESLRCSGRAEWGFLSTPEGTDRGSLAYQQITYRRERYSLVLRHLIFDVGAWENRIYAYEPGVRYSFSFPAYYGKGIRTSLVTSFTLNRWLKIRMKLGTTHYAHRHTSGTGWNTRPGDTVWDAEVQLEVKW
jgi:hypothetical protein